MKLNDFKTINFPIEDYNRFFADSLSEADVIQEIVEAVVYFRYINSMNIPAEMLPNDPDQISLFDDDYL
jgi:hypothetical protein